jgi:hypothetical protein
MKKKVIIKLLEKQRDKVNLKEFNPVFWVDETLNIVEQIFGKESSQWKQINELVFKDQYLGRNNGGSVTINGVKQPNERDNATNYIDSFIEQVRYIDPKNHSFDSSKLHIDKTLFYTLGPIIIGACFYLGIYFGTSKFDKEKIEYYNAQEKWKYKYDSIKKIQDSIKSDPALRSMIKS